MNDQLINDLMDVLLQESKIYEDILEISKNKTDVIVKGKVNELENITNLEQSLIFKIGKLEESRESLVAEISDAIGVNPSEMTVSELEKHVDKKQADRLKEHKEYLSSIIGEIKNINEINSKLIKNSIDFIDFSINILSSISAEGNNYSKAGQVADNKKKNYFDIKL
ncbi:flagellar protein FlgN [Acetivibrio mesophilus]|uniref:Flagellar protein FlgN n=1 Tax=Acetivibrio mesophilus TaxID=2487273 RepID=A0A4Q0I771_9FIRM|nr:flagellar protein FlgN [Acetivibrio mesophilus]ODM27320.1 flagellar biosynthesis protein FlgN [Clostridium sp. Bc-iso-3]RXE58842.1 flagellar protein FlgN [Acetivibrio mesophilus]HHV29563.1 flagellar protein FlgN [Clostridium sp.]